MLVGKMIGFFTVLAFLSVGDALKQKVYFTKRVPCKCADDLKVFPLITYNYNLETNDHVNSLEPLKLTYNIPGVPGIDYPTYDEVPETSFSCVGRLSGYYADPETRCQAFRICLNNRESVSFLCANGTVYDQRNQVCDWWSNVHDCGVETITIPAPANSLTVPSTIKTAMRIILSPMAKKLRDYESNIDMKTINDIVDDKYRLKYDCQEHVDIGSTVEQMIGDGAVEDELPSQQVAFEDFGLKTADKGDATAEDHVFVNELPIAAGDVKTNEIIQSTANSADESTEIIYTSRFDGTENSDKLTSQSQIESESLGFNLNIESESSLKSGISDNINSENSGVSQTSYESEDSLKFKEIGGDSATASDIVPNASAGKSIKYDTSESEEEDMAKHSAANVKTISNQGIWNNQNQQLQGLKQSLGSKTTFNAGNPSYVPSSYSNFKISGLAPSYIPNYTGFNSGFSGLYPTWNAQNTAQSNSNYIKSQLYPATGLSNYQNVGFGAKLTPKLVIPKPLVNSGSNFKNFQSSYQLPISSGLTTNSGNSFKSSLSNSNSGILTSDSFDLFKNTGKTTVIPTLYPNTNFQNFGAKLTPQSFNNFKTVSSIPTNSNSVPALGSLKQESSQTGIFDNSDLTVQEVGSLKNTATSELGETSDKSGISSEIKSTVTGIVNDEKLSESNSGNNEISEKLGQIDSESLLNRNTKQYDSNSELYNTNGFYQTPLVNGIFSSPSQTNGFNFGSNGQLSAAKTDATLTSGSNLFSGSVLSSGSAATFDPYASVRATQNVAAPSKINYGYQTQIEKKVSGCDNYVPVDGVSDVELHTTNSQVTGFSIGAKCTPDVSYQKRVFPVISSTGQLDSNVRQGIKGSGNKIPVSTGLYSQRVPLGPVTPAPTKPLQVATTARPIPASVKPTYNSNLIPVNKRPIGTPVVPIGSSVYSHPNSGAFNNYNGALNQNYPNRYVNGYQNGYWNQNTPNYQSYYQYQQPWSQNRFQQNIPYVNPLSYQFNLSSLSALDCNSTVLPYIINALRLHQINKPVTLKEIADRKQSAVIRAIHESKINGGSGLTDVRGQINPIESNLKPYYYQNANSFNANPVRIEKLLLPQYSNEYSQTLQSVPKLLPIDAQFSGEAFQGRPSYYAPLNSRDSKYAPSSHL